MWWLATSSASATSTTSAAQIGHGHEPPSLEAVREGARGQRQYEPWERVSCCDRRHRERVWIYE